MWRDAGHCHPVACRVVPGAGLSSECGLLVWAILQLFDHICQSLCWRSPLTPTHTLCTVHERMELTGRPDLMEPPGPITPKNLQGLVNSNCSPGNRWWCWPLWVVAFTVSYHSILVSEESLGWVPSELQHPCACLCELCMCVCLHTHGHVTQPECSLSHALAPVNPPHLTQLHLAYSH